MTEDTLQQQCVQWFDWNFRDVERKRPGLMRKKHTDFIVKGNPHGKARPRMSKFGGVFTPEKTRSYESIVYGCALEAMKGASPSVRPISVEIVACFDIPNSYSNKKRLACLNGSELPAKKPDIDNIQKAILDPCNGVVWKDDSQVCEVITRKVYAAFPSVFVTVYEME